MKRISGIYKITSPQGKIYIGYSNDILRRFHEYKKLRCWRQRLLYNSLLIMGAENHVFEIIEKCDSDKLHEREKYYIKKFSANNPEKGLNISSGGRGGRPFNGEEKNKREKLTERQVIMISPIQSNSLKILKSKGVNVSQFIRQSIKEKLQKDWKEIKLQKEKKDNNYPDFMYD